MKILIFNPFGIGDVLFTTPLVRNLKEHYKEASITYLCNRRVEPLVKNNIFVDQVLVFEKDEWRAIAKESKLKFLKHFFSFLGQIGKARFDVMFDLSHNAQYGFYFSLLGIKKRIGYNYKKRGKFLTHKKDLPDGYDGAHVARHHLDLLGFLGIFPRETKFDLFLSDVERQAADDLLRSYGLRKDDFLVVVCPGSGDSWQETAYFKRWPQEYFLTVCEHLREEYGAKIILCGSHGENQLCEEIAASMKTRPVNLSGKIKLQEFTGIVDAARLVLTNDGGPFHIAQALGKKTVVFYGPVDERVYGAWPQGDGLAVLTAKVPCRPCYRKFRFPPCPYDKKCLRQIAPEQAIGAIAKLLKSGKNP